MDATQERMEMVTRLRDRGYLTEERAIEAMLKVPRHLFMPPAIRGLAYEDRPQDIGCGQTISAPHMVAIMAEALEAGPGMKVLEVGAGSGYHAAVLAELVRPGGKVFAVERVPELVERAKRDLASAGYEDVTVLLSDGTMGLRDEAPFDRISVAAGAPSVPRPLMEQLAEDGIMLVPVGGRGHQELIRIERKGDKFLRSELGSVMFVPLIGEHGHPDRQG
jgi:protein-L-isoaspartate(D-aspartate) O-methyltransferase